MKASPLLLLALLLTICFTLATRIEPRAAAWSRRDKSNNVFSVLFGDGRRLFANQFFTMADVYFHSGYYPSIFDKSGHESEVVAESHGHTDSPEDEKNEDFLGKPKDWIDAFGRNFRITKHTHLEHGNEREILPWLRLAADMDPQMIDTYTVGAFYLREHLNRPQEAEAFLREGLRNNPDSCEILFELGRVYYESDHDPDRARNVWQLAVQKFIKLPSQTQKDDRITFEAITVNLAPKKMPATSPRPSTGFRLRRPFRSPPACCKSRLTTSKRKWPRRRRPDRAIPLGLSAAALV